MSESIPTLATIVGALGLPEAEATLLHTALTAREDLLASSLHMAGVQFGLYPAVVAEVIASIGLGSTPTDDERLLIRRNFIDTINSLREQGDR